MTKETRSPNDEGRPLAQELSNKEGPFGLQASSLFRHSSFVIRHSPDTALLLALRTAAAHLSATDLALQLQLSTQELSSRIDTLRAAGYDIELHPHLGYRFLSAPDRLIADDLYGMLDGVTLARKILVFEKTGSTNDVAARMGRDGEPEGLVVFAEEQTAGRGRLGRKWESNPRLGLWFSVLLRPAFSHALWTRLTTWAAVAIAEAIETEIPFRTAIKWPNDVYIDGKKAVGILTESHFDKSQEGFAVLGIGVNINHEAFPGELADKATSMRMAAGHALDRQKVAAAILARLDALYGKLEAGFPEIVASAGKRSFLRGKNVRLMADRQLIEGVAEGLDRDGALLLRLPDGSETVISSGEVTLAVG